MVFLQFGIYLTFRFFGPVAIFFTIWYISCNLVNFLQFGIFFTIWYIFYNLVDFLQFGIFFQFGIIFTIWYIFYNLVRTNLCWGIWAIYQWWQVLPGTFGYLQVLFWYIFTIWYLQTLVKASKQLQANFEYQWGQVPPGTSGYL